MFLLHIIFDGEIILPAPSWVSYAPQGNTWKK
jgi:aspartate aminotransferase